ELLQWRRVPDAGGGQSRPDQALALRAVALRAHAVELLLAEVRVTRLLGLRLLAQPRVELRGGDDLDRLGHPRVLKAAELGALTAVDPRALRPERDLVQLPGDRIHLRDQRRDEVAVHDVPRGGGDLELHEPALRHSHAVDRHDAVRGTVAPVELPALDLP